MRRGMTRRRDKDSHDSDQIPTLAFKICPPFSEFTNNWPLFLIHLPLYSFYSLRIQERIFQVASTSSVFALGSLRDGRLQRRTAGGFDQVGSLLPDHDRRSIGIPVHDGGHNGGIHDTQTLCPTYP